MTRALLASRMTEDELQANVLELCYVFGLLAYHTHDSRRSQPGFPDLVIVGRRGVLWRELKSARGKLSCDQQRWIDALDAAGQDVGVWKPEDWLSGLIRRQLEAVRR